MAKKIEINQEHLENEISSLEKGHVESIINLIKIPVFVKRIEEDQDKIKKELKVKDLKEVVVLKHKLEKKNANDKRLEFVNRYIALEDTKGKNKASGATHEESIINIEEILEKVYLLRK